MSKDKIPPRVRAAYAARKHGPVYFTKNKNKGVNSWYTAKILQQQMQDQGDDALAASIMQAAKAKKANTNTIRLQQLINALAARQTAPASSGILTEEMKNSVIKTLIPAALHISALVYAKNTLFNKPAVGAYVPTYSVYPNPYSSERYLSNGVYPHAIRLRG